MKTTLDATPGGRFDATRTPERNEERETPDPMWALVVTHALVERLPILPRSAAAASEAPPDVEQAGSISPSGAPAPDDALGADEGTRASGNGRAGGRGPATNVPSELCAEVSDERLGRLALRVVRGQGGLDIVIGVADSHVKALIMGEQSTLMRSLKDAGLAVASLQIGPSTPIGIAARAGTHLAVKGPGADRQGAESPGPDRRAASFRQPGPRWRGYLGSPEKDDDDDGGVDFTA